MTLAAGDFSGDGADDLAVGLPFADVLSESGQTVIDGGTVTIMQGIVGTVTTGGIVIPGATGLTELNANFIPSLLEHFGATLAAGDFDGDGRDDLAIGTPDEAVVGNTGNLVARGGFVAVFSGGTTLHSFYTQLPLGQNPQAQEQFGAALVAADFNGDGADDLAIGTPGDVIGGVTGAGSVNVIFGILNVGLPRPASAGLPAIPGTLSLFTQATTGVIDDPETGDHFGATLTAANLGRSAHADLVIGTPDEDILVSLGGDLGGIETETRADAGAVYVLYGSATGPQGTGSQRWSQNSVGVPDVIEAGDRFGSVLSTEPAAGESSRRRVGGRGLRTPALYFLLCAYGREPPRHPLSSAADPDSAGALASRCCNRASAYRRRRPPPSHAQLHRIRIHDGDVRGPQQLLSGR